MQNKEVVFQPKPEVIATGDPSTSVTTTSSCFKGGYCFGKYQRLLVYTGLIHLAPSHWVAYGNFTTEPLKTVS